MPPDQLLAGLGADGPEVLRDRLGLDEAAVAGLRQRGDGRNKQR